MQLRIVFLLIEQSLLTLENYYLYGSLAFMIVSEIAGMMMIDIVAL